MVVDDRRKTELIDAANLVKDAVSHSEPIDIRSLQEDLATQLDDDATAFTVLHLLSTGELSWDSDMLLSLSESDVLKK